MFEHPDNQPKSTHYDRETAGFSASGFTDRPCDEDLSDDVDLFDDFDPDSDASCWDPGEIDLEESEIDESDFCLEDEDDDG